MENLRKKFNSPTKGMEPESQSIFHAPLVCWDGILLGESEKSVVKHLEALGQFCDTGFDSVNHFSNLLQGTKYNSLSQLYKDRFSQIREATLAEAVQVTALIKNSFGQIAQGKRGRRRGGEGEEESNLEDATPTHESDTDVKLVACTLARLMQLHCQFLITASEVLEPVSRQIISEGLLTDTDFINIGSNQRKLAAGQPNDSSANKNTSDGKDTTEQVSSGKGITAETKANLDENRGVESPSGLRKISSFFSKLGRSGSSSSDGPQSSFYVSLAKDEANNGNGDVNRIDTAGKSDENHSIVPKDTKVKLDGKDDKGQSTLPGVNENGQLATQEELDSVIDLLSGGQRSPMQVIPENLPSHHISKTVGSQYTNTQHVYPMMPDGPVSTVIVPPDSSFYQTQLQHQHRPSDGMIGESFMREQKTNTWPYRPHQRTAVDDIGTGSLSHPVCGYEGTMPDTEYSRYLASIKGMKPSGHSVSALSHQGPWANTDAALNKSWPIHLYSNNGMEHSNRNWSTVGDSSSCSDESSTGDAPWMMGLDLMGAVQDKRRHSSGEESFPTNQGNKPSEARPRSVENLLETKSTNTWPPKQPWTKAGPPGPPDVVSTEGPPNVQSGHPPLTMHWSDPLTNRPLSTWGAGTMPNFSNQRLQSFPSLAHGASAEFVHANTLLDRPPPVRK